MVGLGFPPGLVGSGPLVVGHIPGVVLPNLEAVLAIQGQARVRVQVQAPMETELELELVLATVGFLVQLGWLGLRP